MDTPAPTGKPLPISTHASGAPRLLTAIRVGIWVGDRLAGAFLKGVPLKEVSTLLKHCVLDLNEVADQIVELAKTKMSSELQNERQPIVDEYIQLFVEWLCAIVAETDSDWNEIIDLIDRIRDGQLKGFIETKQRLRNA